MASKNMNPDIRKSEKIASNIPDFLSKNPGKLVNAKRANTGKLNLHLVSSTPLHTAKRANFFDESNQFGSPIRSGGSSSDSPDNKIKLVESEKKTKTNMLKEEQAVGASPFPFVSKLDVKKMTICASDEDTDDDIFEKSRTTVTKTKKVVLDFDDDLNSSADSEEQIKIKTKEPARKLSSDDETNDEVVKNPTKVLQENNFDVVSDKNVLKTKKSTKSSNENKENEIIKKKSEPPKTQPTENNTEVNSVDNKDKPNLKDSPKQRKSKENAVQKKKITKNKNENDDINSEVAADNNTNKKLTPTKSDTEIKTAENRRKIPESGVRKSSRSCVSGAPFWQSRWDNITGVAKRSLSEEISNATITSDNTLKRPNTVPETVTKREHPKMDETKSENTVILTRTRARAQSEQNNTDIKNITNEANNLTLNSSKTRIKLDSEKTNSKEEKTNSKEEKTEEGTKNVTLNKSRSKVKTNEKGKKSKSIDQVSETAKTLKESNTTEVDSKAKETHKNVLKSNESDQDTQLKDAVPNEQRTKKRKYSKEILDKESKERKNKVENIAAKLRSMSPKKSNSKDTLRQSVLENEVFETISDVDNDSLREIVAESIIKSNSARGTGKDASEVFSPPRTSKKNNEKTKKATNKIVLTPGVALKHNKNEAKSTKRKIKSNEKKINRNAEKRTLRSNSYFGVEVNGLDTENLFNSENSDDDQERRPRKRRAIEEEKPVKMKNKTSNRTPGLGRKQYSNKSSKQVNFNVDKPELDYSSFETDSLSSYENPSRVSCKASYNYNSKSSFRQYRRSRDSRYPRKSLFYRDEYVDGARRSYRKPKYMMNDSTIDDSDDSWISEDIYVPHTKRRKYMVRRDYKKREVDSAGFLNFKEKALAVQVPAVRQTLTEIEYRGKFFKIECFGTFPKIMTKINDKSSMRGTCFMNDMFASGIMEITLGTVKKCNASNNHTYFIVLDGMAEIGIADSVKILRIGDCCIVPKHTFYYVANASSSVNLLLNFLKISI